MLHNLARLYRVLPTELLNLSVMEWALLDRIATAGCAAEKKEAEKQMEKAKRR